MREPFWWPMMEPPMPNIEDDWYEGIGWDWSYDTEPVGDRDNLVMEENWND